MTTYKFVVLSKPVSGREDEYNDWYENTHLDDVLDVPGIERAQRFEFHDAMGTGEPEHRYLAIYDIETDNIDEVFAAFNERANTERMRITDAMDQDIKPMCFRALAPARVRKVPAQ
jgi:hypothetical protein